jgi:hypothetical protein
MKHITVTRFQMAMVLILSLLCIFNLQPIEATEAESTVYNCQDIEDNFRNDHFALEEIKRILTGGKLQLDIDCI